MVPGPLGPPGASAVLPAEEVSVRETAPAPLQELAASNAQAAIWKTSDATTEPAQVTN